MPATPSASATTLVIPRLEHIDAQVSALRVHEQGSGLSRLASTDALTRVRAPARLMFDGAPVIASGRFWKSLFKAAGINDRVLRLFSADEVFSRIAQREGKKRLRFTLERAADGDSRLLAVVPSRTAIIGASRAIETLHAHGAEALSYSDGVVTSRHVPAADPGAFKIGRDEFEPRFSVRLPLDGFGDPRLYVALLRLACLNGAIGVAPAFTTKLRMGRSPAHALDRALGSYANADGFSAVRRRLEAAQSAWASVAEVMLLERVLEQISWGGGSSVPRRRAAFDRLTGNIGELYGVASPTAISARQRTLLPTRARAYELINFATEVATHHAPPGAAMRIQAWFGMFIADEFNLEGSANEITDFDALLVPPAPAPARALPARGASAARGGRTR